jgi:hypothetical protein
MVTGVELDTALVVTVNAAVVAPVVTVVLASTCAAAVLLLESVTTAPPAGALPLSVTIPADEPPPCTLVGFSVTEVKVGGFTINVAVCAVPYVPVIVADVEPDTALVVTVNTAIVAPASTGTLVGTWADVLLLDSVTVAPPAEAGPLSVTVPVELFPPITVVGLSVREDRVVATGLIVRVTVTTAGEPCAPTEVIVI